MSRYLEVRYVIVVCRNTGHAYTQRSLTHIYVRTQALGDRIAKAKGRKAKTKERHRSDYVWLTVPDYSYVWLTVPGVTTHHLLDITPYDTPLLSHGLHSFLSFSNFT
jgi:hypothetical protein